MAGGTGGALVSPGFSWIPRSAVGFPWKKQIAAVRVQPTWASYTGALQGSVNHPGREEGIRMLRSDLLTYWPTFFFSFLPFFTRLCTFIESFPTAGTKQEGSCARYSPPRIYEVGILLQWRLGMLELRVEIIISKGIIGFTSFPELCIPLTLTEEGVSWH